MSNKKAKDEVVLEVTIVPEKITIGHVRLFSASAQKDNEEPLHFILDTLQEITLEDIFTYPLEAIPAVIEAIGNQMNEVANPESPSGNS